MHRARQDSSQIQVVCCAQSLEAHESYRYEPDSSYEALILGGVDGCMVGRYRYRQDRSGGLQVQVVARRVDGWGC